MLELKKSGSLSLTVDQNCFIRDFYKLVISFLTPKASELDSEEALLAAPQARSYKLSYSSKQGFCTQTTMSERLSEQLVQDAFHSYLKSGLAQAKAERLLDTEVLSSAEADLMITGMLYTSAVFDFG